MICRLRWRGRTTAGRARLQRQRERTRAWGDLHSRRGGEAGRGGKINVKTCRGRGRAAPSVAAPAGTRKAGVTCLSTRPLSSSSPAPGYVLLHRLVAADDPFRAKPPVVAQRIRPPHLGPLRPILVPGPRVEIAERLVLHEVHLAEELDPNLIGVAVIDRD